MNNVYENILKEVYEYGLEELDEKKSEDIRENIIKLRNSYRVDTPVTDYDNEDIRKAYMLAYYPNYTLPINKIMKDFVIPEIENNTSKRLKISFFAAGPAPELYGSLKALNEINFNKRLDVFILDYEKQWEKEREVTVKLLKNMGNIKISPLEYISGCDLRLDCKSKCVNWINCEKKVFYSDIYIMENCINHMQEDVNFDEKLRKKLSYMKNESLFIIIDLNYQNVKNVLNNIVKFNEEYVEVLASNINSNPDKSVLDILIPEKIKQYIFTGQKGLIAKKNTNYYYLILKRK